MAALAHKLKLGALPREAGPRRPNLLRTVDRSIGLLVAAPAALLVAAEIVVLFLGVVSRCVFHSPIVWSDELASILFFWLAMLGSVVTFRNSEYMRMTALVGMARPSAWPFFEMLALTIEPAFEFAERAADRVRGRRPAVRRRGERWQPAIRLPPGRGADGFRPAEARSGRR